MAGFTMRLPTLPIESAPQTTTNQNQTAARS
jgi:hypothetical protein